MVMLLRFLIISFLFLDIAQTQIPIFVQARPALEKSIITSLNQSKIINLYGLSGMGKTTISRNVEETLLNSGYKVFWLNWHILSMDEQLNNELRNNNSHSMASYIQKMGAEKPLIIVVDNYTESDLELFISRLTDLYANDHVKFIISSRQKINGVRGLQIPPFTKEEGLSLMLKYFPHQDKSRLERISESLGLYPYFISVISRTIESSNTLSLERLEDLITDKPKEIIERDFTMNNVLQDINSQGNTAIISILNNLKNEDPKAYLTLCFMSMLNPKSIPIQLVHAFVKDEKEGDRIIEKLSTLTLFSVVNKKSKFITYDLHEITQKIAFETLTLDDKQIIIEALPETFIEFYSKDFMKVSASNEEDQVFFNHLQSIIEKLQNDNITLPLRILAIKRNIYSRIKSESEFKESSKIDQLQPEVLVKNQDILFEYYIDWAYFYCFHHADDKQKFDKGIQYAKKAIEIAQTKKDLTKLFRAHNRLIWVNLYGGNVEESKYHLSQTSKLLSEIDDPFLRKEYYFGSSWYYLDEGDFEKAKLLASEGVAIDATSKSSYVGLYLRCFKSGAEYRLGLLDEASVTVEDALQREYDDYGNESTLARAELLQVKTMVNIGKNDLQMAEKAITESINIFTKNYGDRPYHPKAVSIKILSDVLLKNGNISESEKAINSAITMFKALIQNEGTYEFGEALLIKLEIDLLNVNYDRFMDTFREIKKRFNEDHDIVKRARQSAVSKGCEWLLT